MTRGRPKGEDGVVLVTALLVVMLLSLTGLGLALTAALEPATCRNVETAAAARLAVRAAVVLVAQDLADVPDWSDVLRARWLPADLSVGGGAGPLVVGEPSVPTWSGLTHLATCGRETSCTSALRQAPTVDRPWGTNNPDWVWLGVLAVGPESLVLGDIPFDVGVWVGDDGDEADGDPGTDGGASAGGSPPGPGAGVLRLRAAAFGRRGERAALEVLVSRSWAGEKVHLAGWRDVPP